MSSEERYGTIVWQACVALAKKTSLGYRVITVGEVAKEADVSRVTARKYLLKLVEKREIGLLGRYAGAQLFSIQLTSEHLWG